MFNKLNRCTLALMLLTSSMSFSGPLSTNVVDPNQLYGDDDIRNVVENRVSNNPNIFVAPIYPIDADHGFIKDTAEEVSKNLDKGIISLISNNLGGRNLGDGTESPGHWTAVSNT